MRPAALMLRALHVDASVAMPIGCLGTTECMFQYIHTEGK